MEWTETSCERGVKPSRPAIHAAVRVASSIVKTTTGHCSVTQTRHQFCHKCKQTCFFFLFPLYFRFLRKNSVVAKDTSYRISVRSLFFHSFLEMQGSNGITTLYVLRTCKLTLHIGGCAMFFFNHDPHWLLSYSALKIRGVVKSVLWFLGVLMQVTALRAFLFVNGSWDPRK